MTKKFFAILLALVLTLSLSAVAFADEGGQDEGGNSSSTPTTIANIPKEWTVTGDQTVATVVPTSLTASVTGSKVEYAENTSVTAPTLTITYDSANRVFNLTQPSFTAVGLYTYTIKEDDGKFTGVTVSDTGTVKVQYLVTYSETEKNDDGSQKIVVAGPYLTGDDTANKKGKFSNTFESHTLTVKKEIKGNLGNLNDTFDVKLTFSLPTDTVIDTPFTISGGSLSGAVTVNPNEWRNSSFEKTLTVTNGSTYTIANLPKDVVVTVVEQKADTSLYTTSYKLDNSDYTAGANITMDTDHTVVITNTNEQTVNTGITMDSIPYIVLLALAVVGIAAVTMKKRYEA